MDNKYIDGNYYINEKLNNFTFNLNPNNSNYEKDYVFNMFNNAPVEKLQYDFIMLSDPYNPYDIRLSIYLKVEQDNSLSIWGSNDGTFYCNIEKRSKSSRKQRC